VYSDLTEQGAEGPQGRSGALAQAGVGLGGGLDRTGRRGAAQDQTRAQAAQLLATAASDGGLSGVQFEQEVRIVADEITNSLVILATPRDYQAIVNVLHALDIVPRQVLVEMLIAEITLDDNDSFGITHTFGNPTTNTGTGGNNDNGNGDSNDVPDDNGLTAVAGLAGAVARAGVNGFLFGRPMSDNGDSFRVDGTVGSNGISGLTFRVFGDYKVTLDALARQNKVKVLSRPHILTADNQEARILVGQEVPIITSQADTAVTGTGGQSRFLQNVQYRDTGVVVNVTPQVNSEGLVNMLVSQEVSEVAGADQSVQGIVSPTFTTREAETTVVVQSGETVVIGGIISETKNDSRSGVPYLMDVPVVGQLFRSHSDSKRKIELIILITPYVVRDRDEARSVTAQFKERVDDVLQELNIEEVKNDAGHTVILQRPVM
jgi:general secretion pathway protein D